MRKNYFYLVLAMVFTVNAMAQNIPSYVPKEGLVGYWPFNGNANDESGNGKHGIVNGANLTTDRNGVANSAYQFGTNKSIYIPNFNLNSETGFALSLYYKSDATYTGSSLLRKESSCNYPDFLIQIRPDSVVAAIRTVNQGWEYQRSGDFKSGVTFHHIIVNYDLNYLSLFIDNKLLIKTPKNSKVTDLENMIFLGMCGGSSDYFSGIVDDIAIYKRPLSEQEITALFTNTPLKENVPSYVPKDGLVGYWPFNGNADDESGNGNNGTNNGATLTTDRNGIANSAYSFDGNSNFIVTNNINSNIFSNGITISLWVKVTKPNYDNAHFFVSKERDNVSGHFHVGYHNADDKFYGQTHDNSDWTRTRILSNNKNVVPQIIWHHIVLTYDNNNIKFYTNFNDSVIKPYTLPIVGTNSPIYFGTNNFPGWQYFLIGQLDDIAIYNRALTQQEINALYSGTPATGLASTKVFVDAPASVNQNDTLELSISTETLNTADNVIAFQTDITYDTTRYTFVSNHTVGTLNPKASVDLNTDKKGTIKVGYISTSALQGAGSLLKLKFKANQKVGQGIFGLSQFIYNNTDITSLKNDTVLTLDVTPPSATISLSQNPVRKGDSLFITVKFSEKMTVRQCEFRSPVYFQYFITSF